MKAMLIFSTMLVFAQAYAQKEAITNIEYRNALKEMSAENLGFKNAFHRFAQESFDDEKVGAFLTKQIKETSDPGRLAGLAKLTGKFVKHSKNSKASDLLLRELNNKRPDGFEWNLISNETKDWNEDWSSFITDLMGNTTTLKKKKLFESYAAPQVNTIALNTYMNVLNKTLQKDKNKNSMKEVIKNLKNHIDNDPIMQKEVMDYLSNMSLDKDLTKIVFEEVIKIGLKNPKQAVKALSIIDRGCHKGILDKEAYLGHMKNLCDSKELQKKMRRLVEKIKNEKFYATTSAPPKVIAGYGMLATVDRSEEMTVGQWFDRFVNRDKRREAKNKLLDQYKSISKSIKEINIGETDTNKRKYCPADMHSLVSNAVKNDTDFSQLSSIKDKKLKKKKTKEMEERIKVILSACGGAQGISDFGNAADEYGLNDHDQKRAIRIFINNKVAKNKNVNVSLPDDIVSGPSGAFGY